MRSDGLDLFLSSQPSLIDNDQNQIPFFQLIWMLILGLFPSFLNSNGIDLDRFLIELKGYLTRNVKSTLLREHTQKGVFTLETPKFE